MLENRMLFWARDPVTGRYSELVHLAEMIAVLGPPPHALLAQCERASKYFDESGKSSMPLLSSNGIYRLI